MDSGRLRKSHNPYLRPFLCTEVNFRQIRFSETQNVEGQKKWTRAVRPQPSSYFFLGGGFQPYFCAICSSASPAAPCRSSAVITGCIRTVAPTSKNRGSTKLGIWEASSILTTRNPPRVPSTSVKYAASG